MKPRAAIALGGIEGVSYCLPWLMLVGTTLLALGEKNRNIGIMGSDKKWHG